MTLAVQTRTVTISRTINAAPAQIYYAFTNGTALRGWMCNGSQVNGRVGGSLFLTWNVGYYVAGEYTTLEPDKRVAFTWQGRGEPHATEVEILIEIDEDGTRVTITHSGMGEGEVWETITPQFEHEWTNGLDNLKSVLETGADLRVTNRPAFGLTGAGPVDAERAAKLGLPQAGGLFVGGITEGMGAHKAGLQEGDVLISIAGKVLEYGNFLALMAEHKGYDKVAVEYFRAGQKRQTTVELIPWKFPEIPADPAEFAGQLKVLHATLDAELDALLAGVTEAEADHHPAPGEWNVKENLAHLIFTERHLQFSIFGSVGGDDYIAWPSNNIAHLAGTLAAHPTLADLVAEMKRTEVATEAIVRTLPAEFLARKGDYNNIGQNLMILPNHNRQHFQQMREAIDSARK